MRSNVLLGVDARLLSALRGVIEQLPLDLVLLKNVSVVGIFWGSYTSRSPKRFAGGMAGVAGAAFLGKAQADPVHGGIYARHARQGPR